MTRVKAALRNSRELCAIDDLYAHALSNGRNDISILKSRGWGIDAWWTAHNEGVAHKHYRLTGDPEQVPMFRVENAEQMVLV